MKKLSTNDLRVASIAEKGASIPGGSNFFSKIERGVKELGGKVGDKAKDVVAFVKENPKAVGLLLGGIAAASVAASGIDPNVVETMTQYSVEASKVAEQAARMVVTVGGTLGSFFSALYLKATKKYNKEAAKAGKTAPVASKLATAKSR